MPYPLYDQEKNLWFTLDRRLGEPQSLPGYGSKRQNLFATIGNQTHSPAHGLYTLLCELSCQLPFLYCYKQYSTIYLTVSLTMFIYSIFKTVNWLTFLSSSVTVLYVNQWSCQTEKFSAIHVSDYSVMW
jgi:hypothetical protein